MFTGEFGPWLAFSSGGAPGFTNRDHQLRLLPGQFAATRTTATLSYFREVLSHLTRKEHPFVLHWRIVSRL